MLKLILSPFRCCLSPPSTPILIPAPIPLPDPIPEPEQETAEEEIDPIAMLAAVLAARAGRSARLQPSLDSILFPAPRRRVFKPTLDTIIEEPEREAEAMRADLDILKAALELWAQAAKAELRAEAIRAELEERKAELELEAEATRAEHEESKVAPNHKRRQNWMKRVLSKCKRKGGRDQRENREAGFRVKPTGSVSMLSDVKIYK